MAFRLSRDRAQEKFMSLVSPEPNSGCWLWAGAVEGSGYGMYSMHRAHRLSHEFYKGPIPKGMVVRHHCDNPCCVNPSHLDWGTPKDNYDDMVSRGRAKRPF
jgi:hypothetical protein